MQSFGRRITMMIKPITGRQRARRSQLRFGCLRIIPHVVRQFAGVQSDQPISEYLESRKRPVCDCALQQQSVLVVGQELQALDLVSFDGALPSEKGRASVDLAFEDVLAGIVAALCSKFTEWMHGIDPFVSGFV